MSTCDNTIKQLKPETTFLDSPQDRTNQQRTKKKTLHYWLVSTLSQLENDEKLTHLQSIDKIHNIETSAQ